MCFQSVGDDISIMQGNYGHAYLYVAEIEGPCVRPVRDSHKQVKAKCEVVVREGLQMVGSRNGSLELVQNGDGGAAPLKVIR